MQCSGADAATGSAYRTPPRRTRQCYECNAPLCRPSLQFISRTPLSASAARVRSGSGWAGFVCLFVCLFAWVHVCREREENEALALKLKEMEKAVVVGGTDFSQDEELMLEWEQMIQASLRA